MEVLQRMDRAHAASSPGILLSAQPGRLCHWGSQAGASVDFVLEWGRNLLAIEVKLS